jgi:putative addiction module component (TIGR02574 family)
MASLLCSLGIDRLSVDERLQLIDEIWESIRPAVEQTPLTDEERQLLDQRLATLDANPQNVTSWEEVEARALARFRQ